MKKYLFPLCFTAILLSCVSCEQKQSVEPTITIEPSSLSLFVGQKDTLLATIKPEGIVTDIFWDSSNAKVATVDTNGVVTAKAEGEVIITAISNYGNAQCTITVASGILEIDVENYECSVYETRQLIVTKPEHKSSAKITWKSSNTAVASVDSKGNVTGLTAGKAIISASVSGCKSVECSVTVNQVELSYPRTFLIEHFTGEECGYCPGGMYAIVDHIENATTPYIWVSHHYGFGQDEYTIPENSVIGKSLGVSGAPNMALNRTQQTPGLAFHPGYLPEININDATDAAMSVNIDHTYNADTRQLNITVSGQSTFDTDCQFLLTVLIKENRLVGRQADYVYSWQTATWKEYMHARVVRDIITKEFGDTITINNQAYSQTWNYTVDQNWIPENCCVVAYLTPLTQKPIINAAQIPLVAGTTGGEEYDPYGITEGKGPNKNILFHIAQATKYPEDNILEVVLISNDYISTAYGNAQAVGIVYINTDADTIVAGTYPIQEDNAMGTITAGYRIDEKTSFGGSLLLYAVSNYLAGGQIAAAHIWRMNNGEMVVDADGNITFNFTTYGGTSVSAVYTATDTQGCNMIPKKRIAKDVILLDRTIDYTKNVLTK